MVSSQNEIKKLLPKILPRVQKPARYTGGELNQIVKDWDKIETKIALVFPDIYDLGMSNLGLAILYDIINKRTNSLAERAFAPWLDMESYLRDLQIPLYSLETKHPLYDFDIIGFSLPYETLFTNTLNILDLSRIEILSSKRKRDDPLIIAGGHATFNPETMHAFIDAFVIGEGEEVTQEIINVYQEWRRKNDSRIELLKSLSSIWGVYVPIFYEKQYHIDGTISNINKIDPEVPLPVIKRIVPILPPAPTNFIVPFISTIHDRIPIEIMRGCTRGCRFCHAGMVNRPVRERQVDEIIDAIEESLETTGFEEVGLLSLSSSDYTHILELVKQVSQHFSGRHLSVSLPSLRIESFSVELMDALADQRRTGFTLAPEAATDRMRNIINKPIQTDLFLETTREIYQRGWSNIKLYFMIGLPRETREDVEAIAKLARHVLNEGKKIIGKRAKVTVSVSTFIPKPQTPFQWEPCESAEVIQDKIWILRRMLRGPGLKLNWNPPEETILEAWLSRGDRRMSEVILEAWKLGAKFDAWSESFDAEIWLKAFEIIDLDPYFYSHRKRPDNEIFPWDHISTSVRKSFLRQDYQWSLEEKTREDCRQQCYACGILPNFNEIRRILPDDAWKCPPIKEKSKIHNKTNKQEYS